jgi:UDPglucose--hexose-1-phosphate uridylyltransferase
MSSLRRDYLLPDKWVIIAPERAKRPREFIIKRERRKKGICPFCPGNEEKTPPATLVYLPLDGKIKKAKDADDFRHKGWLVRCFPNLYPALRPSAEIPSFGEKFQARPPVGFHEVLVESPNHNEHPSKARIKQLSLVIEALIDRIRFFSEHEFVEYVVIFRNYRRMGGATLSHSHMQIVATPLTPKPIRDELREAKKYFEEKGTCAFCDIIAAEKEAKSRIIYEDKAFIAFCPWASSYPYEFWIFPSYHEPNFTQLDESKRKALARVMKACFNRLAIALGDPPYNFGFHLSPIKGEWPFYHWHLEVYPKLSILGGLEKSMGIYINTISPEAAARTLRTSSH